MRATTIWFVQNLADEIVSAFTVKHELVSWLRRHPGLESGVYRIPDGGTGKAEWIEPRRLGL